ncbi:DEAD/DEAH box helicase [Filimonas effusa]|uniref:ATP-dependent helicase n=1 Tax=Filimonas effusa TaxID=2508721 RepID=A0A4Q1CZF9_9BACT|nr:DEAD/DEAH box helicase [Filimonas effusa]RXK80773.1 ATP-dependent helicase [Filimonas effusa]
MFQVTQDKIHYLQEQLLAPQAQADIPLPAGIAQKIVVLRQHKYYRHLVAELYEVATTQSGKLKNPLRLLNPLDELWKTENVQYAKFFTAISRFQNQIKEGRSEADIEALRALVKNPAGLPFYSHNGTVSENVIVGSLQPVKMGEMIHQLKLMVERSEGFYTVYAHLVINGRAVELSGLVTKYDYFISNEEWLYLIAGFHLLKLVDFFRKHQYRLMIAKSDFASFQQKLLAPLEEKIHINYSFVKAGTPQQLKEQGIRGQAEKMVFLSDAEFHVNITPVMRYGDVEIEVRSKKQIYLQDSKGNTFQVRRNERAEDEFIGMLLQQHPDFAEQVDNEFTYFYLPKAGLLSEEWFLPVFDSWREAGIQVYGFNDIKNNRLNAHKVKIQIVVTSGQNWFNTSMDVRFGKKKAALKQLHKAVRNKSRYVELDDGTLGVLPEEWLAKLDEYFSIGEIIDDLLSTPKINFASVSQVYEDAMLDETVKEELAHYEREFSSPDAIREIPVPHELQATLRHYQWQGLNWLNFLDEFSFGGCLSDDMGLGKSVQIIAFILSQRHKVATNNNLIVAPTSLLFNWRDEIEKWAPSIRVYTHHGTSRTTDERVFHDYEVVLTSYGMLLSDNAMFRRFRFNYVFADESQNIKNTNSQRYKAMRLLQSRNRVVITGTPVENNTFDLYGQLSFACPGLLGSKQFFRDVYAIPIDRFKDSRRAKELQQKIHPFILRRTKQQVATELPDKTEMLLYCPMGEEQRKAYDAYEKELRDYLEGERNEEQHVTTMHVLKGITRLRQICDAPALLGEDAVHGNASVKMEMLMEQLMEKTVNHKVLVFSQFVSMLSLIEKELGKRHLKYALLTGSTLNREAVVNDFKNKEDTRVFLLSLKAGGTGLNLTEADYVYLVDPWWNPAVENQAIDRCYRIGQQKNVVAVRLICPDTVEEKMMKLQAAKKELVQDLIQSDVVALLQMALGISH